jgi:RNA recognition motif. (a.k.a. RRM, RBD, or RNP domain)
MISNLPIDVSEFTVLQFLDGIDVQQVMLIPDTDDSKKQKAIVKLKSAIDQAACDSLMKKSVSGNRVTVTDFASSKTPAKVASVTKTVRTEGGEVEDDAGLALKLRGLPYSVTEQDVKSFFQGYNIVEGSIKIGLNGDGSKTGEGAVLFENEADAQRALKERQGYNIGKRYIELYNMYYKDFREFEKNQGSNSRNVRLAGKVEPADRYKVLKVRGLPYSVTEDDICYLFKEFRLRTEDVLIEVFNGKKTGYALVFFDSEKSADNAKAGYNGSMIGNRYIEILSCGDKDIS